MRVFWVAILFGLVFVCAPAHASPSSGGFSFSLSGGYRSGIFNREWSGFLSLNVALERFAAPRAMHVEPYLREGPPKKEGEPAPEPTAAVPASAPPVPRLSSRLARGSVRRALATAGYLNARTRLSSLAARARSSAVLPELALRTQRSSGQTLRLTPTTDDPYRYTQAGTSELSFEARLTWHLDRLVFADEEVTLERLQIERDAAERRLIAYVLERLEIWQRGKARAVDSNLDGAERETAALTAISAAIELDVLTDGWFSQAIGESDGPGDRHSGELAKVEVNPPRHAR